MNLAIGIIIGCVVGLWILLYRMAARENEHYIWYWLTDNPGWHFGLEIVEATGVSRSSVYVHLARLQDKGRVERLDAQTDKPWVRPQFRAAPLGVSKLAKSWNDAHKGTSQLPVCPNCGVMPSAASGIDWSKENRVMGCPSCKKPFTRNQWFGLPQADDYPGGPLDRHRPQ